MTYEEFKSIYIELWDDEYANYDLILYLSSTYPEFEERLLDEQDEQENQ